MNLTKIWVNSRAPEWLAVSETELLLKVALNTITPTALIGFWNCCDDVLIFVFHFIGLLLPRGNQCPPFLHVYK